MTQLTSRYHEAFSLAFNLHQNQTRKGSPLPYISHLMAVSAITLEYGGDEDQAIAALLHDAVEDQGGYETLAIIRERFGEGVAAIVADCSDSFTSPKPPWRERKEQYLVHLGSLSERSLLVALADKVHNARALLRDYEQQGEAMWARFNGGRDGTLWYQRSLVDALSLAGVSHPLLEELRNVVGELEEKAASRH